jgi:PAS domain S-box-containing protein
MKQVATSSSPELILTKTPLDSNTLYALESNSLLQSLTKNMLEAAYRSTKDDGFIFANHSLASMFGYDSVQDVLGMSPKSLLKKAELRENLIHELDSNGVILNREIEFKRKDGSCFWGSMNSIKVQGRSGQVFYDGIIRDITKEKATEEAIFQQARSQQLLLDISYSYMNTPNGQIKQAIQGSLKKIGQFLSVDRIQIHSIDPLNNVCSVDYEYKTKSVKCGPQVGLETRLDSIREFIYALEEGRPVYVPSIALLPNGVVKQSLEIQGVQSLLCIALFLQGKCVGFLSADTHQGMKSFTETELALLKLFADLSINLISKAKVEQRLQELVHKTHHQNQRLKDFSYITSHTIRSSAVNLVLISDFLHNDPSDKKYLELLRTTVGQLNKNIHEVSDLLNYENSLETEVYTDYNLWESLQRVIKWHTYSIAKNRINVTVNVPKSLEIHSLPSHIDNVFNHVISNAIRHGMTILDKRLWIDAKDEQGYIEISFTDFGKGIDLGQYGDRIFQAGARFHAENHNNPGLGLFTIKYLMETLGGSVFIQSEINKGTTVVLKFAK